jgi:hypothetical protein
MTKIFCDRCGDEITGWDGEPIREYAYGDFRVDVSCLTKARDGSWLPPCDLCSECVVGVIRKQQPVKAAL